MALTKYKLGDLIYELHRFNSSLEYGLEYVRGISNSKEITKTKADIDESVIHKFYVINPGEFIYNPRTTRMGDKVGLGYNNTSTPLLFTFNNIAFGIKESARNILLPYYLYIYFNRAEFDRYAIMHSWGSATELFTFDEMCDIDIELPALPTQQKYVAIYNAMVANQQSYERGLEDLRIICDGHFDSAKKESTMPLGSLIERVDSRNSDNSFCEDDVKGITNNKEFAETRADVSSADLSKFKIVEPWHFAYNSRTDGRDMLVLALNKEEKPVIVTFNYNVFKIRSTMSNVIDAEYLYAYFKRSEFDRRVRFSSWGSSQELLSWDNLCEIAVPVPAFETQKSIASIMNVYILRKNINEQLKAQIKDICPILIRGSLEEVK